MKAKFVAINWSKANVDEIHATEAPRDRFSVLGSSDVQHAPRESVTTICSGRDRGVATRYVRVAADDSRVALGL